MKDEREGWVTGETVVHLAENILTALSIYLELSL